MKPKRNLISAAVVLAIAAASASPAYAVLERMGPIDKSPTVGGFPSWFQDKTGVTLEFCAPSTQAELDGGWCLLLTGDTTVPENFPTTFFDEHFYFAADNVLLEPNSGFRARLVIAQEAAFNTVPIADGQQSVFQRHRIFLTRLPLNGDYRVITPYQDVTYFNQVAGDRIFETNDIGIACSDFLCSLDGPNGPWLLPSATAGGAEVPPMPDLLTAAPGTDPFFDSAVAQGAAPTGDPGTGKKYIADPARVGPITGSQLAPITVYDIDNQNPANTKGVARSQDHNTFRVEVRASQADGNGDLLMVLDGATNFTLQGRLMTGSIPGNLTGTRSTYKADASGNVTDLDVFTQASPTVVARIPGQPISPAVTPVVSFYDVACGGAITVDPLTGAEKVNPGPYTAPAGAPHNLANTGKDFWGQSSPGGLPPSHVCVEDTSSRNAAGQVVPSYYLVPVTDHVIINTAHYVGPENGTLTVNAVSSDPTAVLSVAGYGPAAAGSPGVSVGVGAGTGLELAGTAAQIIALKAPPSQVQVVSSKGGSVLRKVDTAHGVAQLVGAPSAVNDSATIDEDCSPASAASCAVGQGVTIDLLANDTVMLNGTVSSLRDVVAQNLATVTVSAQAPRLGSATVSADGFMTYVPSPNANGTDNVIYTVTVDGQASNQAVAAVTINAVNDVPVAASQTINGVAGRTGTINLLLGATDPDGATDVKDAVLTTWPAELGPQPTPVNGVISFTPAATGNFSFNFLVQDAAGAQSANTALGTITSVASESITFQGGSTQYTINKNRWIVQGTDTVRARQEISIVYTNGIARTGENCGVAGSENLPACVVGRVTLDGTGTFLFDQIISANSSQDPRGTFWSTRPTNIRAFSSKPVLGGSTASTGIFFK
jgi:hypothetical protein